jgi:hypothetical protein
MILFLGVYLWMINNLLISLYAFGGIILSILIIYLCILLFTVRILTLLRNQVLVNLCRNQLNLKRLFCIDLFDYIEIILTIIWFLNMIFINLCDYCLFILWLIIGIEIIGLALLSRGLISNLTYNITRFLVEITLEVIHYLTDI